MSTHKECGANVQWARRDDEPDRYMPPLEPTGPAYIINAEGVGVYVQTYQPHICDPEDVANWLDRMNRLAEVRAERSGGLAGDFTDNRELEYAAAREQRQEEQWGVALLVDCTRCLQPAGDKCISMAQHHRKNGEQVYVNNPHPQRLEDGYKAQHKAELEGSKPKPEPEIDVSPPTSVTKDRTPGFCWNDDQCVAKNHTFSCPKWGS